MATKSDEGAARQVTIARGETFKGIALHGGGEVQVRLLPAAADAGIVFRRVDAAEAGEIRAHCRAVGDTRLATTLVANETRVGMVEHLLSALAAARVDNVVVELDGAEVPILDGSAAPWGVLLEGCGRVTQAAPRRRMRVRKTVRVEGEDGAFAEFAPASECRYRVEIDYPNKVVAATGRVCEFVPDAESYARKIARARTFCCVTDVEAMHKHRRALGGSLQNALVYDDKGVINEGGLRYPDEFARHKMLDAIGDCYVNGYAVVGAFRARKPGHGINNALMRALVANEAAWGWEDESRP